MTLRRAPLLAGLCFVIGLAFPIAASAATPAGTVDAYASALHRINPQLPSWQSHDLARNLLMSAQRCNLDANMLAAIVTVESSWHTHARSSAGAIGLGQLMPGTAATLGVNPRDPAQNIAGAAAYLRGLMHTFGSNPHRYELVFAAYNAGPKAVIRFGGIPPYDETQRYVVKVLRAWHHLESTVHLPRSVDVATAEQHGADVDYWMADAGGR